MDGTTGNDMLMDEEDYKFHELFLKAANFAIEKHGLDYYNNHLFGVCHFLLHEIIDYEFSEDVILASLLHDTLEDTDTTSSYLVNAFGERVYNIVWLVTDKGGNNREQRHKSTYPMIREDDRAIVVKLADRIQNVRRSPKGERHYKMYKSEYQYFRDTLRYDEFSYMKMWDTLDELMEYGK